MERFKAEVSAATLDVDFGIYALRKYETDKVLVSGSNPDSVVVDGSARNSGPTDSGNRNATPERISVPLSGGLLVDQETSWYLDRCGVAIN